MSNPFNSSYNGTIQFGTPVDARDRELRGAQALSEMYGGITYDRDQIEGIFQGAVDKEYAAKQAEYGRSASQYTNRLAQSQNAYLDAMRRVAQQNAVQRGASFGMLAANELGSMLGMSQQTSEDNTKLVQQQRALIDQQEAARAKATRDALDYSNQQKHALGQLDAGLYASDAQKYVGELAANAQVGAANVAAGAQGYAADKGLEGQRYTADQNLAGVQYNADQNLAGNIYTADQNLVGQRYASDQMLAGTQYTADKNLAGNQYSADKSLASYQYTADRNLEGTKYATDANTAMQAAALARSSNSGGYSSTGGYSSSAAQYAYQASLNYDANMAGISSAEMQSLGNNITTIITQGLQQGSSWDEINRNVYNAVGWLMSPAEQTLDIYYSQNPVTTRPTGLGTPGKANTDKPTQASKTVDTTKPNKNTGIKAPAKGWTQK